MIRSRLIYCEGNTFLTYWIGTKCKCYIFAVKNMIAHSLIFVAYCKPFSTKTKQSILAWHHKVYSDHIRMTRNSNEVHIKNIVYKKKKHQTEVSLFRRQEYVMHLSIKKQKTLKSHLFYVIRNILFFFLYFFLFF